jgi:PAS domain S-box-containing protein
MSAPLPPDEQARLDRLRELLILDSEPEALFDTIARQAAELCGTPIALMSLVDKERQWFKANVGLPGVNETPRDVAFCAHAILQADLFTVPDARQDSRFARNPLVKGAPGIRFYAGMPLTMPDGSRVGTLCVIDRVPRAMEPLQVERLTGLARIATEALAMRRDLILRALAIRSEDEQQIARSRALYRDLVEQQSELVSLARPDGELVYVNQAYAQLFGREPRQLIGANLFDLVQAQDREAVGHRFHELLSGKERCSGENRNVGAAGPMARC